MTCRTRRPSPLHHGTARHGTARHGTARTNIANGKSITSDGVVTNTDKTVIDIGDGTSTVRSSSFTSDVSYDASGTWVHQFVGRTIFDVLTDNGGTPTDPSDDEFLEFLGV